jgi:colanic acid biosynthesis glycosyl transferase WcaI
MRVLFLNQYYPPDVSATAYLLGELTEDLAQDHEIRVLAGRPSYSSLAGAFEPAGVDVEHAWSTTFDRASMAGRLLNYASFMATAVVKTVRAPRPEVVLAFTDPPVIGIVGMLAAARHHAKFVYGCWDIFPDVGVAVGRLDNPLLVSAWRRLNRVLRARADRVVAVGRDMCEKLESEGVPRDKIAVIPHWASGRVPTADQVQEARAKLGWDGRFVVMHAGNVGLPQNLGTLIRAADRLRDREAILFVVLGDGAAKAGLEHEVSRRRLDNVEFKPYRPRDDVEPLLDAADLHLVSLAAGLKGAVVASKVYGILAAGRPFVAAVDDGSEIARMVEESGAGVRVDPGDGNALALSITEFLDGTRDGEEAGRRGRREFEAKYTRAHAVERYRRLLEAVAGA